MKLALALAAATLAATLQGPAATQPTRAIAATPAPLRLWRLDCGDILIRDYNAFFSDTFEYPAAPKNIVASCYLIRHGNRYFLWDAGLPSSLIKEPTDRWTMKRSIADQLADLGVRPNQIELLGVSHYHYDHIGQAAEFQSAKLLIGKADFEALQKKEGPFNQPDLLAPWLEGKSSTHLVERDHDVFGDGRVLMLSLPGHTRTHYGLLVRLSSGAVLLSGDLYHVTEQVERRGVPPFNWSRGETLASMERFQRIARNLRATSVIQHEPADIAKLPRFPAAAE